MPRVLNRKKLPGGRIPAGAVYIGRPGPWGNVFEIGAPDPETGKPMTRSDVIARHAALVAGDAVLRMRIRIDLRDKDLVCWCAPECCHGDTLLRVANGNEP